MKLNALPFKLQTLSITILLFLGGVVVNAQNLENDSLFFESTLPDYELWLEQTSLSKAFEINEMVIEPDLLTLNLMVKDKETWFSVRNQFEDSVGLSVGKYLFEKLCFQMEVAKDSAYLVINTQSKDYTVEIFQHQGRTIVEELLSDVAVRGIFEIDLNEFADGRTGKSKYTAKEAKLLIKSYYKNYFESKEVWWNSARFDLIEDDDVVSMEISNLKKEVLDDFLMGYYELLLIDIYFKQEGDMLQINYTLQAKYGSGVFSAPRRSGYKDMETKYPEYLDRYRKKFRYQLQQLLQTKILKD